MTNENVYLKRGDSVKGPLPKNQLRSLLREKKLRPTDHVSPQPSGPWSPITDFLRKEGAKAQSNNASSHSSTTDSGTTILVISLLGFLFPFVWPIAWILGKKYVSDHKGQASNSNGNYGRIIGKTMTLIFFIPMFLLIPLSFFQAARNYDIDQHGPREFSDFTTGEKIPRVFRDVFAKAKSVYKIETQDDPVYYMSPDLEVIVYSDGDRRYSVYDGRTVKDKDQPGFKQDTGFKNTYYKPSIEKTDDGYELEFREVRNTNDFTMITKSEITMGNKEGSLYITVTMDPGSPIFTDFGRKPTKPRTSNKIPLSIEKIR